MYIYLLIPTYFNMTTDIRTANENRDIIDLIKENIIQDKKREVEYTNLKDYISFLKEEITHKNKLLFDRYKNNNIDTRL